MPPLLFDKNRILVNKSQRCIMKLLLWVVLMTFCSKVCCKLLDSENIIQIMDYFDFTNPCLMGDIGLHFSVKTFKKLCEFSQFVQVNDGSRECKSKSQRNMVLFLDSGLKSFVKDILKGIRNHDNALIVLVDLSIEIEHIIRNVNVNQNVMVLDTRSTDSTWILVEEYNVNSKHVRNTLANINVANDNACLEIVSCNDGNLSFLERRGNFFGLSLTAMTEQSAPGTVLKDGYMAMYDPSKDWFDVTNHIYGYYMEVLQILMEKLNFTAQIFKRKDGSWGGAKIPLEDGSFRVAGAIGDVYHGRADMFVSSVGNMNNRSSLVDFMPPMSKLVLGLHISNNAQEEEIYWGLYFEPWRLDLWITLLSFAMLLAIVLTWLDNFLSRKHLQPVLSLSLSV